MANSEHVEIVKQGAGAIAEWRNANQGVQLDLSRAKLMRANLEGANLEGANLVRAKLMRANLEDANLEGANLENADFESANLKGANLKGANTYHAKFEGATLVGAGGNSFMATIEYCFAKIGSWLSWIAQCSNVNKARFPRLSSFYEFVVIPFVLTAALLAVIVAIVASIEKKNSLSDESTPTVTVEDWRGSIHSKLAALSNQAEQLEKRLSTLSADDVSMRLAAFETQIDALDNYIEQLFAPKKGDKATFVL